MTDPPYVDPAEFAEDVLGLDLAPHQRRLLSSADAASVGYETLVSPVARLVAASRAYRASSVYVEHEGRFVFAGTAMHDDDLFRRPDGTAEPLALAPIGPFSISMELTTEQARRLLPLILGRLSRRPVPCKHPGRRYPRRKR